MDIVKSFAVKNVFFSGCQQVCDKPEKNESFRYINVSPVRCLSIFVADIYEIKVFFAFLIRRLHGCILEQEKSI